MLPPKWCSYCRKTDHDDSECSCTRPADWKPSASSMYGVTELTREALRASGLLSANDPGTERMLRRAAEMQRARGPQSLRDLFPGLGTRA